MDRVIAFLLSPLLLAQALHLRRRAPRLLEPPGPREGHAGEGPPLSVLILGDSSAAGVGTAHQNEALSGQIVSLLSGQRSLSWRLDARTGATSADALASLVHLPPGRFDVALIVLGVNDVTRLRSPERVRRERAEIARLLATDFGVRRLVVCGVPPMGCFPALPQPLRSVLGARALRLDRILAAQAAREGWVYLPFDMPLSPDLMAEDGYHPSAAACRIWAETLRPHLLAVTDPGTSGPRES